ncbi:MAG TPA: FAD binding domain-containing protein, partial [Verrucomicrobiae bacterium]|nr:FAD binding domain-containing protein [Verrucomicrobiae bacterium]
MKSFEYAAPKTLKEATTLLGEKWGETEILAGGTDLVTSLKQHIASPARLVSLRNIADLKGIEIETKSVRVGAMTTLGELAENKAIKEHFRSLVTAAQSVGSPQLLSVGTVGGDLCQRPRCWYFRNGLGSTAKERATLVRDGDNRYHAIFATDGPALFVSASSLGPALIALDATLVVVGPKDKKRKVSAAEFFHTPKDENERETALKPNEILAEIEIPLRGLRNGTYEVRHRHGLDWPYVTASVAFESKAGMASGARVVLGHVASVPWMASAAAKALNGARADQASAAKCGDAATQGAKPLGKNGYKVQLVKAAVKRAVLAAPA